MCGIAGFASWQGGADAVALMAARMKRKVQTFTIGFDESFADWSSIPTCLVAELASRTVTAPRIGTTRPPVVAYARRPAARRGGGLSGPR